MMTYISILRGINVSGQKNIKMDALKEVYEDLHFTNVQTYIQSGNVVFQCDKSEQKDLALRISQLLQKKFGFNIPVIVLEIAELKSIIRSNPYQNDPSRDISHLHVTFLASGPEPFDINTIDPYKSPNEELTLTEKAVYLYCPYGYGKTKLTNAFFENKLKTGATTRNWRTTTELLHIAEKLNT
ncbi:MAG: DUF1697 domain-containing protein [Bacteroidales bacterium]|nr:DUF1697 domain-containing protein [Bacteroidales bacterium]